MTDQRFRLYARSNAMTSARPTTVTPIVLPMLTGSQSDTRANANISTMSDARIWEYYRE